MDRFAELLELLTTDEAIATLSRQDLDEARRVLAEGVQTLTEEAEAADAADRDELLTTAEQAAELVARLDAAREVLDEADREASERAERLRQAVAPTAQEADPEDEDDDDEEAEATPEVEPEAPEQAVAASVRLARLAARFRPSADVLDPPKQSTLVASASGVELSAVDVYNGMYELHNRIKAPREDNTRSYHPVARLSIEHSDVVDTDPGENYRVLTSVAKREREAAEVAVGKGDAVIVADGGFCAPAQPIYDFFDLGSDGGLLTLPSVGATRQRISVPDAMSVYNIFNTANWDAALAEEFTNADDEAATDKPCFMVPCWDSDPFETSAYPICLTFGNFSARAWPEFIEAITRESLKAARHKVNASMIAKVLALSTSVGPYPSAGADGGAVVEFLKAVTYYSVFYRDRYRMAPTAVLDLVVPQWVPFAFGIDAITRDSTTTFNQTTAELTSALAARYLRAQFVHDWQTLSTSVDFPTSADALLFPAGTFVRLDGGMLDVGIVRDSATNVTNTFQQFSESWAGIAKMGAEGFVIQNAITCPTGATGDRVAIACQGS